MPINTGFDVSALPNQEALPPDPSLFFARIRLQRDPIIAFKSYYLTEPDLRFEADTNFESRPPISLSINNFNLQPEAANFIEEQSLQGTPAEKVVQMMPKGEGVSFQILADVQDKDMPLPRSRSAKIPGNPNSMNQPHAIQVVFDKDKGFIADCESLSPEQISFCLQMLIKSLDTTLSRAGKGRIQPGRDHVGKNEDSIIFDNYFLTATDADLTRDLASQADRDKYGKIRDQKTAQLKYLQMTLQEILDKRG